MSLLDDDIDHLLQSFRADEGRLDDATRARIWARVRDEVPAAPIELDTLDRLAKVRRLRRRVGERRPRGRVLAVAAAVLVLLAVGALAMRSGPNEGDVVAGPPTTLPLPRTLQELAEAVAELPTATLGDPGATYTYRRATQTLESGSAEPSIGVRQEWVALDGTGRVLITGDNPEDQTLDRPGTLTLGALAPGVAVALPDDAAAVIDAAEQAVGPGLDASPGLVEVLTYAGLPGAARAGVLRALDRLGFRPVPAPALGPNLLRVEGRGPDGSKMQADLDLRTGQAVATARPLGGGIERLTDIRMDLRRDTTGS